MSDPSGKGVSSKPEKGKKEKDQCKGMLKKPAV